MTATNRKHTQNGNGHRTPAGWLALLATVIVIATGVQPVLAQATGVEEDPFQSAFFPPDLVMKHAREIGLTTAQRTTITESIIELQGQATALQLEMIEAVQTAVDVASLTRVDEAGMIEKTGHVLDLERQLKLTQMRLLVRIKNALTEEQQTMLTELRRHERDGEYAGARVLPDARHELSTRLPSSR